MTHSASEKLLQILSEPTESSYDLIAQRLRKAQALFREYVCEQLQDPLNIKLQELPHETYDDKRRLAVWLNSEFLSFSIAAKCPKTGFACTFQAEPGWNANVGQLRMRPIEDDSRRTFTSVKLVPFSLTPRPIAKSRFEKWTERTAREGHDRDLS